MFIVLQATSNKTHKEQSETNHSLLTTVVEAQTLPLPSSSAHVLLPPSSLSAMVSDVSNQFCSTSAPSQLSGAASSRNY